jgi:hypothetical protein
MNISKFFRKLRFIPNIEIIVALLPEMFRLADQSPRYSLLQRLYRVGESVLLGFAEQRVNVFGHDDIAVYEAALERVRLSFELCAVTAEGHKVSLPGRVKSFQSPRHERPAYP